MTYPQPANGNTQIVKFSDTPVISRSAEEVASDTAKHYEWLDYALIGGDTLYGKEIDGDFIYQADDGERFSVSTSALSLYLSNVSGPLDGAVKFTRFGNVSIPNSTAKKQKEYYVTPVLADVGQDTPVLTHPDSDEILTDGFLHYLSAKPDGSAFIIAIIGKFQRTDQPAPVGFLRFDISGSDASISIVSSVQHSRADTLGTITNNSSSSVTEEILSSCWEDPTGGTSDIQRWVGAGDSVCTGHSGVGFVMWNGSQSAERAIIDRIIWAGFAEDGALHNLSIEASSVFSKDFVSSYSGATANRNEDAFTTDVFKIKSSFGAIVVSMTATHSMQSGYQMTLMPEIPRWVVDKFTDAESIIDGVSTVYNFASFFDAFGTELEEFAELTNGYGGLSSVKIEAEGFFTGISRIDRGSADPITDEYAMQIISPVPTTGHINIAGANMGIDFNDMNYSVFSIMKNQWTDPEESLPDVYEIGDVIALNTAKLNSNVTPAQEYISATWQPVVKEITVHSDNVCYI